MRNNENNIIFNVRNITLNLKNITTYFTGKEKIITLVSIIIMLSFTNITLSLSDTFYNSNVSALSYQTSTNIGFTFLPTLNVSLSSNNLTINNLVPGGNAVDSNTITINVSTNIVEGYNLMATVGSSNDGDNNNSNTNTNANTATNAATSNGYNTTNLVNTVDNSYTFTPLSSNISELANFANNTWGYSYSLDSGTTWISGDYNNASTGYNGLPLYTNTGIKLVEKADSTNSTVNFKIAAKASSAQPSGEYTNVINFTVVSNTIPTTMLDAFIASGAQMYKGYFKMQDMTPAICKSIDTDGEKGMQLIDVRDDKLYWVAKLKDNNCWMTQNLDLDLSHEVALNSVTSDIDPTTYNTGIYTQANGYSKDKDTGVVSWLPSTIVDVDGTPTQRADTIVMNGNSVPNWADDYNRPYSADPGERYWYTNPSTYNEHNYTSLETCANNNNNDTVGCQHSHFGNYYNWPAAVASNNTSGYNSDTLTNSVCPKNWDLPVNGTYGALMQAQDVWSGSDGVYAADGFNKLRTAPLYYQQFGYVSGGPLAHLGSDGDYWSSTVYKTNYAYGLYFNRSDIWLSYGLDGMGLGFSVRCMAN